MGYVILILLYVAQILVLVFAFFNKNKYQRYVYSFVIFLLLSIYYSYTLTSGHGFNRYDALLAVDQFTYIGDALNTFYPKILFALFVISIFIIFINILIVKANYYIKSRYVYMPLVALTIFFMFNINSGTVLKHSSAPFQVSLSLFYALTESEYFGKREEVSRKIINRSKFDKIIFLMDESIRGDMLSINDYSINTTPFLKKHENLIFNYGIASSSFNCSTASNLTVQSGLQITNIPDVKQLSLKDANIFDYMNKANYTTIFIDGQNTSNRPIHGMTIYDIKNIDVYIQVRLLYPDLKVENIDLYIADIIAKELKKYKKVFIYVNKSGAHFPYKKHYPESKSIFPTIDNSSEEMRMKNSYYNAIRWNVDDFFEKLIAIVRDDSPLIMYTSDHGQNIYNDISKSTTHCNKNPVQFEGNIPFFILPINDSYQEFEALKKSGKNNYNKISHFNIFPTLISFAGYKLNKNEKTIFDKLPDDRIFFSGDMWGRTTLESVEFKIKH